MQASKNTQPQLDSNGKRNPSLLPFFSFFHSHIPGSLHYLSLAADSAAVPSHYNSLLLLSLNLYVLPVKNNWERQEQRPKGNKCRTFRQENLVSVVHQAASVNVRVNAEVEYAVFGWLACISCVILLNCKCLASRNVELKFVEFTPIEEFYCMYRKTLCIINKLKIGKLFAVPFPSKFTCVCQPFDLFSLFVAHYIGAKPDWLSTSAIIHSLVFLMLCKLHWPLPHPQP